ncbi:sigma-70 family RNA polymerase sigma factor [Ectobacillus polymachus]|uniref:sigma-70 family RNA polymerase sigma factor n=1 Tax=Ectobacillus polymachus TaxID=1508806 RepID=UPI003A851B89
MQETEEEIITRYIPLVRMIVSQMKKRLSTQADENELHSLGMIGLWDAIHKFDATHDNTFESYAAHRIRGEILDGLRKTDTASRSMRQKEKQYREAYETLEQTYMRQPTSNEMSKYLGITLAEYEKMRIQLSFMKQESLDEPWNEEDESKSKLQTVADVYYPKQEEWMEEQERKQRLAKLIDTLPYKEKLVLSLIYYENLNVTETGHVMGLHKSRISQLHSQAMKRLRITIEKEGIEL